MIRDKKLAVGMGFAFILGLLWGIVAGDSPGETFLRGSLAVACAVATYPFWRQRN
jgi:cell shape-determining protein MreD